MKKIMIIVGARPQFIKVAPVSREIRKNFNEIIVNTGQHYDYSMSNIFFEELDIPKPDYNLEIGSSSHGKQTGEMMIKLEEVVFKEQPDAILVYGDTNSTIAGALVASKLHIPLLHVESGLRSYNKRMPEEINRVLTDHVSDLLFCPTDAAVNNLHKEGLINGVSLVGDVMYDAFLYNKKLANDKFTLNKYFNLKEKSYILATIHRAENTDNFKRLKAIFDSLGKLEEPVILPLHPRTRKKLIEFDLFEEVKKNENIKLMEPISYLEMILLESGARVIITDSGGVQKEAYFSKVPCITLREETEWVETIHLGWNTLVNPVQDNLTEIMKNISIPEEHNEVYGDGRSSEKIVKEINNFFNNLN